jgi:glycosyltransferase involved in cell wall biosynthesis
LAQETDFSFEVIVRDDASTDGTQDILLRYADTYPHIIKLVLETENKYSKGVPPLLSVFRFARGRYIAICEGDDYWISTHKLQAQYQALRSNPECDMCFHKTYVLNSKDGSVQIASQYARALACIPAASVIERRRGVVPTASMVLTRSAMVRFAEFRQAHPEGAVGVIFVEAYGAQRGGALYLNAPLSVYRRFTAGSVSARHAGSADERLRNMCRLIEYCTILMNDPAFDKGARAAMRRSIGRKVLAALIDTDLSSRQRRDTFRRYRMYLAPLWTLLGLLACLPLWPSPVIRACRVVRRWFINAV